MTTVGSRVGAVQSANDSTVKFFGFGVYEGDEVPFRGFGAPNPKIKLDNGKVVWGFQCWWGDEAKVKESFGSRSVVVVDPPGVPSDEETLKQIATDVLRHFTRDEIVAALDAVTEDQAKAEQQKAQQAAEDREKFINAIKGDAE